MKTKQCNKCNVIKPISKFSSNLDTLDKYDNRCKDCAKVRLSNKKQPRELDLKETDFNNKDWQGGKYSGTVFQRSNGYVVAKVTTGERGEKKLKKEKSFNPKKYGSVEKAREEATKWKNEMSDKLGATKNKYKLIFINDKPLYIIVQMSQKYVMLCDIDQLNFIKNHTLFASKSGKINAKIYCRCDMGNSKIERFHGHVIDSGYVDHINRYPLDNRKINLRDSNPLENNNNRSCINKITIDKDKISKKYNAKIIYTNTVMKNSLKEYVTKEFKHKKDARKWIEEKKEELNKINDMSQFQIKLKNDFESIMTKYADNFKWCDLDDDINMEKQDEIKKKDNEIKEKYDYKTKKRDIYLKFKKLYSDYEIPDGFIKNGLKIEHIKYDNKEFKYCSKCENWLLTTQFWGKKRLEKRCISCKKSEAKKYKNNNKLNHKDNDEIDQIIEDNEEPDVTNQDNKIIYKDNDEIIEDNEEPDVTNKDKKTKKYNVLSNKTKYDLFTSINSNFKPTSKQLKDKKINHLTYNNIEYKFCPNCVEWKNISNYYPNNETIDKLRRYCKKCETKNEKTFGLGTNDEKVNKNRSNKLKDFYSTEEGKKNKKLAHKKRSETMAKKREERIKSTKEKQCRKCKITKLVEKFLTRNAGDGLQSYCRDCMNAIKKEKRMEKKMTKHINL